MPVSYRMLRPQPKYGLDGAHVVVIGERDDAGRYPYGEISVSSPKELPNFDSPPFMGVTVATSDFRHYNPDSSTPTELFTHVSPQIRTAYVDNSLRHTVPTMVGLAMGAHNAEHDIPMADTSLTRFSSDLSRNAVAKGLAKPHPRNAGMETSDSDYRLPVPSRRLSVDLATNHRFPAVSDEEVQDARNWVKGRIRSRGAQQFSGDDGADIPSESQQEWSASAVHPGPDQMRLF